MLSLKDEMVRSAVLGLVPIGDGEAWIVSGLSNALDRPTDDCDGFATELPRGGSTWKFQCGSI
jgi:hypothetical protein